MTTYRSTHLGDGAYLSIEAGGLRLSANSHIETDATDNVCLGHEAAKALHHALTAYLITGQGNSAFKDQGTLPVRFAQNNLKWELK